jgi:anti-sigma factor RsiW
METSHPSLEDLVAYRDGELPGEQKDGVALHLEKCPLCRAEADRIEEGLRQFERRDPATYTLDLLTPRERLEQLISALRLSSIQQMSEKAENAHLATPPGDFHRELIALLAPTLGPSAAGSLAAQIAAAGSDRAKVDGLLEAASGAATALPGMAEVAQKVREVWDRYHPSSGKEPAR